MSKKTVRFEPYYLEDPDDERIPMSVASYASLLKPGFVLDTTQTSESQERSTQYVKIWDNRVGKDQGVDVTHTRTLDPKSGNPTSIGLEASTFGMPEGSGASIKFETRWDKGNRSYLELQVEGPDINVDKIVKQYQETFRPPSDDDIKKLKKEMNEALRQQQWGSTQDYAQMVLLWQPDDVDALTAMGSAAIISRDNDRAEMLMNRLLELKPDSYEAHMNLGTIWKDRGDYDKAIEQYQAMVDLKPDEAFSHFVLGTVYEEKGDTAKALECYQQAAGMKKSPGPTDFPALAKEAIQRISAQV